MGVPPLPIFSLLLNIIDQLTWAKEFLLALHDLDSRRRILNITLFFPNESEGSAGGQIADKVPQLASRINNDHEIMEIGTLIWGEKRAEAGNMLISGKECS